jgi:translation elongation factor EF-Tu-like GTPase
MMQTPDEKTIECCVTFLTAEEGGRTHPLGYGVLSNYRYRPHFVVGDPKQREAKLEKNVIQEEYLGVAFILGPDIVENNQPLQALVCLVYPNVDYSQLTVGAAFTIREGSRIVGHGKVIKAA